MDMKKIILIVISSIVLPHVAAANGPSRYFYSGDGNIHLSNARNGASFKGIYRRGDGTYDEKALARINRTFSAVYGQPISEMSIRFIEFLDYLEDNLSPGARIAILSGYRSPTYNTGLRSAGRLAAKASLHQYGMASDIQIQGVPSERVWNFVKGLGFGGAGFYHGANVHVDVGPARSWDEETSGVGTDISDDNKLIDIVTDKDIYKPGEDITMRFTRMTIFPIGVDPTFELEEKKPDGTWKAVREIAPAMKISSAGGCPQFASIGDMMGIRWTLPADVKESSHRIRALFCGARPETMPQEIRTPEFRVIK